MAKNDYDVLVIGGGPAGSTTASRLAQMGYQVLVVERERFPRFHIGESLLPRSIETFETLGLMPKLEAKFLRKYAARFACSTTRRIQKYSFDEAVDPAYRYAFQVPRAEFDEVLLDHAATLGVEVREEWEAREIVFDGSRAAGAVIRPTRAQEADEERIRARFVVDATGRDTFLGTRRVGKKRLPKLDQSAIFTHWRNVWREDGRDEGNIQIVVFPHGWFWFIPFRDGRTSVGAAVAPEWMRGKAREESLDAFYDRTVAASSWATEWLAGAERIAPVGATGDFSYRIDSFRGDGFLLVGDASGFIDPLFSTGVHLGIKGGALAAEAIDRALRAGDVGADRFAGWEATVRGAADLFVGLVQAFYAGSLQDLIFAPDQRKVLRQIITSMLSGDVFGDKTWHRYVRSEFGPLLAAPTPA